MFVTAASSNHFKSAKQFIKSLQGAPAIFYDIGLTPEEVEEIKTLTVEYRLFDWSTVPSWGLLTPSTPGYYVWKPIIIHTVFQEKHEIVIWCDSGNVVSDRNLLESHVRETHLYTPVSSGNLQRWTHRVCLDGMKMSEQEKLYPMRNAAIIGFFTGDPIIQQFINNWKLCCLQKELIMGSREDHRHDQSILSCLFYKYKRVCNPRYIGFTTHNDCD
jgi:hypothetical protein